MADNYSVSDGWGPVGPPSTWRLQFQQIDYNNYINQRTTELKILRTELPIRRRTATEILQDAYKANGMEFPIVHDN